MTPRAWWLFAVLSVMACNSAPSSPPPATMDAATDRGADVSQAPARCASDRECSASGMVCNTSLGRCVECNAAGDCGGVRVCVATRCITPVSCTSSRMCPGQVCSMRLGFCVDCETDVDCSGGQLCHGNVCVAPPRTCRSSRECSDMGQVCDAVHSQCVDCVSDTDCPMDRYCGADESCVVRACVPNVTECASATRMRSCDARGTMQREADCAAGQTCRGGSCQAAVCAPGQMSCDPTTFQRRQCNADGGGYTAMPCAADEACRDGACVARACTPGTAMCASMTERSVCGADGLSTTTTACAPGEGCRDGACVARTCVPGASTCTSSSERNVCNPDGFGTTPASCTAMQRCAGGSCVDLACVPSSSTCVDAHTVRVCSADGSSSMSLTCPASSTCTGTMCSGWVCTPGMVTCPAGMTARTICNADGLATRSEPCAAPVNATTPHCGTDNACTFTCNAGFGDCNMIAADGCEVALATTPSNCGRCGNACAPRTNMTAGCTAGVCDYRCNAGFADCDGNAANGCEAALSASTSCGRCGVVCAAGMFCSGGACSAACPTGTYNCDGNPANGCESTAPCSVLLSGFGGPSGYGLAMNCLIPGDDISYSGPPPNTGTPAVAIPITAAFATGLQYYGTTYSSMYVNNNGNITFGAFYTGFTGTPFPIAPLPMIAPWWADVDTRGGGQPRANNVCFVVEPRRVIVTWNNVGYYSSHNDLLNDFQLVLADRSDVRAGDFDVEFRYNRCEWTTGDASGGTSGHGGTPAQAGFDAGNRHDFLALPMSGMATVLTACTMTNVPGGTPGIWHFSVRAGIVSM